MQTQSKLLTTLLKKNPFENIVRKGENTGNQHFLLFPQCFLPFPKENCKFSVTFIFLSSANAFNLDESKILSFGKELNTLQTIKMFEKYLQTTKLTKCSQETKRGICQ